MCPITWQYEFSVCDELLTLNVESIPGGVVTNLNCPLSE